MPIVALDSVLIMSATEGNQHRKVAVNHLPGAYLSAKLDKDNEVIMALWGQLSEVMVRTAKYVYPHCVTTHRKRAGRGKGGSSV